MTMIISKPVPCGIITEKMKRPTRNERGGGRKNRNEIRECDMEGKGRAHREDQTKFFFFSNEMEKKLCEKRKRKRRRGRGAEGGWCLTFFKGILNSLSALVLDIISRLTHRLPDEISLFFVHWWNAKIQYNFIPMLLIE